MDDTFFGGKWMLEGKKTSKANYAFNGNDEDVGMGVYYPFQNSLGPGSSVSRRPKKPMTVQRRLQIANFGTLLYSIYKTHTRNTGSTWIIKQAGWHDIPKLASKTRV